MTVSPRAAIEDFLSYRRLAIIGVSRDPRDFSRTVFKEFQDRGYDVHAVNPAADAKCHRRVADIQPPVEAAIVMTPAAKSESVVRECAAAGVRRVWLYRAVGQGAVSADALKACDELGIEVVSGECPFMFLSGAGWIHSVHALCRKFVGTYPK